MAKEPACQCRRCRRCGFDPWVGKTPRSRKWQPAAVFSPGESHVENLAEVQSQVVALLSGTKTLGEVAKEEDCAAESQPQQ